MSVKLPKSVIDGLRIGLQLHKSGKGGRGLVDETLRMARQGVRTGQWPEWKVVKASAWFARHVADRRRMTAPRSWNRPPNYSPAYVAWALWGDDGSNSGKRWIDKKAKDLRSKGVKASPRKTPMVRKNPYMNCKLFVQTVTGIPKLDDLPSRPFRSIRNLIAGDVLKWGAGTHWAIYIGDGDIMEVEEWGAEPRTVPLSEIMKEMDPPDTVFSTAVKAPSRKNPPQTSPRKNPPNKKDMSKTTDYHRAGAAAWSELGFFPLAHPDGLSTLWLAMYGSPLPADSPTGLSRAWRKAGSKEMIAALRDLSNGTVLPRTKGVRLHHSILKGDSQEIIDSIIRSGLRADPKGVGRSSEAPDLTFFSAGKYHSRTAPVVTFDIPPSWEGWSNAVNVDYNRSKGTLARRPSEGSVVAVSASVPAKFLVAVNGIPLSEYRKASPRKNPLKMSRKKDRAIVKDLGLHFVGKDYEGGEKFRDLYRLERMAKDPEYSDVVKFYRGNVHRGMAVDEDWLDEHLGSNWRDTLKPYKGYLSGNVNFLYEPYYPYEAQSWSKSIGTAFGFGVEEQSIEKPYQVVLTARATGSRWIDVGRIAETYPDLFSDTYSTEYEVITSGSVRITKIKVSPRYRQTYWNPRKKRINRGEVRTQPYKYGVPKKYLKGLPDKVARKRAAEIIRRREQGIKTSPPLPGDKLARKKPMRGSKWTRMYKQKYGADSGTTRAAVARDTGIPVAIINEVYKRGVGASRTSGHRPGANDSSWALARVHAFVMKVLHKKGPINQDPDLARKVMARKNPVVKSPGVSDAEVRRLGEAYLKGRDILSTRRGKDMARAAAEKVHSEFDKVRKKVKVIFTERDPYPDFEALRADVRNNNRMYIYTGHSVTPLWDEQTNWKARAVHDYDHVKEGAGFGLHGEFMAFRASAKKAPQLSDLYMSEIPLQAAAYHLKGDFPDGPQKVVPISPELKRLVNRLGMRQNPSKRRNRNRMANLALDAQTLGKFMTPEDVAMHLGASYQGDAPIEEVVLASVSSIGRKKTRNNPPFRTPPYMRRCVVHLVHDGYDKDAAFAICNTSMQNAGYLSSGEGRLTQRELSSGKRKRKIDYGKKDQKWFDREYERILKK